MAEYALTPKSKKSKKRSTKDIGKDIRSGFMGIGDVFKDMRKDAMSGYSKDLRPTKKKKK